MTTTAGSTGLGEGRTPPGGASEELVRAEIAGVVLRLERAVGDVVGDGDVIVLLESMKMEIPIFAETSGTITRLTVTENSTVQLGDVIATVVGGADASPAVPLSR
ncbi:biotin/lipoyl-binding carrier protein [Pseudonocardia sp. MH-G8]|uniref:biotin/lipoyl-binding carrier protein n=1 Tax=Pseudonocardia sp. MH-G8 TaxID=1854588 RepID=UPI000B9FC610|nr:biotin/lipoyl-binding carrier protein [Pseudonocardia sp. MH-G8]OZM83087.1 acetyl-CoA carboxylase biotin carboxyl carrier protein subunit [Pseudonocardia sp. MH-G8]